MRVLVARLENIAGTQDGRTIEVLEASLTPL